MIKRKVTYEFTCDECKDSELNDADRKIDAIEEMRNDGWKITKKRCLCEDCADGEYYQ